MTRSLHRQPCLVCSVVGGTRLERTVSVIYGTMLVECHGFIQMGYGAQVVNDGLGHNPYTSVLKSKYWYWQAVDSHLTTGDLWALVRCMTTYYLDGLDSER